MKPTEQTDKPSQKITWMYNQWTCKVPIEIILEDKTKKEIRMRVPMHGIILTGYGQTWQFSKRADKGNTVLDSRDNKRKSLHYIWTELVRLLGDDGDVAFQKLTTV